MISDKLKKLLENDDSGIFDTPDKPTPQTSDERLVNSFLEINDFIEQNGHSPNPNTTNILERRLYSRLQGICGDPDKIDALKDFDTNNLLLPIQEPSSIDEIIANDELDLLNDETGILTIKNVPKKSDLPDYVGKQKPCKDFEKYEDLLQNCQTDLKSGRRRLEKLRSEGQIEQGKFFVIRGVLALVDGVGEVVNIKKQQKNLGNKNARLRLIYENGTESDILLRSLARALYQDGFRVTNLNEKVLESVIESDQHSGYIYVLASLSSNPDIAGIANLYKIGFSTRPIAERIKNAEQDPTYLMAPVRIVESYQTYNLNPQKFEHLLHRFFSKAKLDLEMTDNRNEKYVPDEWYVVPIEVINQAIQLVINGEIIHYTYDNITEEIALK